EEQHTQSLLEKHFHQQEAHLKKSQENLNKNNIFEFFNAPATSAESKELEEYFDINFILSLHYRTIQRSSSFASEKKFSLADNVFSSGCGTLKPWKIGRCMSSHMWLKQGIQVTGKFKKAQKFFEHYVYFSQKTSQNNLVFIFSL
ncbi:hypothetical protein VP01_1437g1, partial [Puccinia sorghi]